MTSWPRSLTRVAFLAGVALIAAAALLAWARWPRSPDSGTIPNAAPTHASTKKTRPPATVIPKPAVPAAPRPSTRWDFTGQRRPVSLQIPSLGVSASILPVSVGQHGALGIPDNGSRVGWWSEGPAPGDSRGTAVLAGHVDTPAGPGALFQLRTVNVGAKVVVHERGGPTQFRVAAIREYHKSALPWKKIFNQDVRGRLVIITCGGPFDSSTGHYLDNVVAYAVPAAS